ncbi:MAG TPA: MFS transporter [Micromonosporaceae bacterium]|nr:MFS transporter [Micromonosporaceae bacterium]
MRAGPVPAPGRRAGLAGLLGAVAVSDMGSKMTFVALPWLVLVSTGSPAAMGVVAAAELLPFILALALGGPLVDRLRPRRTSIVTDAASTAVVALLALSYRGGLGVVVVLVAALGALRGMGQNSKTVLLRPATVEAGADLLRMTSVYYGVSRFSDLVFAPLGGVLIALVGIRTTIMLDAVSFALAAVIVAAMVRPGLGDPSPAGPGSSGGSYLAALGDGLRHLWRDRLLTGVFAMTFVTNMCHQANVAVFVPLWVHDVLHSPAGLGLLTGAYALGTLLGSAVFTAVAPRVSRYLVLTLGFLVGGAPRFLAVAFGDGLTAAVVAFFICGVAVSPVLSIVGALLYERVPSPLQARVFGAAAAVSTAGMPLGVVLGGWVAAGLGLTAAALVVGAVYVAATLAPVLGRRTWRQMDASHAQPGLIDTR